MSSIAVVLLNYNGKHLLEKFLPTLLKHSAQASIYIVDNASTDNSKAYVRENFPSVRWIQLEENYGYAEGYNRALKQVNEDIYCLLNTDIEVTEDWLTPILSIFDSRNEIGIIQPKILDYNKKSHFEYAGAAGGFIDKYGFPYCRGRIFDTIEPDNGQYTSQEIFWASGACLFIRRETFKYLNGFDTDFFAHQEEIDLCWRAQHNHIKVFYCNESTVFHIGGATLNKSQSKKTFLNFRNSLYMLYKNLPKKKRLIRIFTRLCWDGLAGIYLMLQLKPAHCWAIVRSHFAFYAHLSQLRKKEVAQQRIRNYYQQDSIIINYYIKGKKRFLDL